MYKYLIIFILIVPLIGIYLVETGSYAGSVGVAGYENGATKQFLIYLLIVLATILLILKRNKKHISSKTVVKSAVYTTKFKKFSYKLLFLNFCFLCIMLFGFGGIKVWLGILDKGIFRANLGSFGAFAYLMTKVTIPALFAYCTILYSNSKKSFYINFLWYLNVLLILIVGSSWGFKSTGAVMLLPAILILFWEVSFLNFVKILVAFILVFVLLTIWFDQSYVSNTQSIFLFLLDRVTVLQGDVSWYLWGQYQEGVKFPNYYPTLLAALGDSNLRLLGFDQKDLMGWMKLHYDWMLSYTSGLPLETIAEGHSIVGSPFSEGLIAGGILGVYIFAVISGSIIAITYKKLYEFISTGSAIKSSLLSTYFCLNIFPWLSGGGITQLFHISNIFSYSFTLVVLLVVNYLSLKVDKNKIEAFQPS